MSASSNDQGLPERRTHFVRLAIIAVGIGVVLTAGGVSWLDDAASASLFLLIAQALRDTGIAVTGAAFVGIVIAFVQRAFDDERSFRETREAEERSTREKAEAEERDLTLLLYSTRDLTGVDLQEKMLDGRYLPHRTFTNARFGDSSMRNMILRNSVLDGADLTGVDLTGSDLTSASFRGADLTGATLSACNLAGADLYRISYDESTIWPGGFDPSSRLDPTS